MGAAETVIASIISAAIVAGLVFHRYYSNREKSKDNNDKDNKNKIPKINIIKNEKKVNDDNSLNNSSNVNTSINNIDNSSISKISLNDSISLEIGLKHENKLENNDKIPFSPKTNESVISSKSSKSKNSSKSSKSQNNPFLHNYENEVICGSNNHKTYTVKNYIGAGSIGIVYSGINNETEEENVAIKIININKNTKIKELTKNEIQIMLDFAELNNVVKLLDHGVREDDIFIIMEKCDKNLSKCEMTEEEIREMLIQFKPVFIHLSEKNLIHRDIKPENILIKYDGNKNPIYKLSDFSISKYVNVANSQHGALGFMTPQMHDKEDYTNKADVYSLGATIHFLLFGRTPKYKEVFKKEFEFMPKDQNLKDLLLKMLTYEEIDRISWDDLIKHPFLNRNEINIIEEE